MSKAKMEAAKELIKEKRYVEARAILKTIDHPTAADWVAKIDKISAPKRSNVVSTLLLGVLGIVIVLIILAGIVYAQREKIPAVAGLFASATPSSTSTATVDSAATAVQIYNATATSIVATNQLVQTEIAQTMTAKVIPTNTPAVDMGKWEFSKKTSELDNTTQTTLLLRSENKVSGSILSEYSTLILRCRKFGTDLYISTEMVVQEDYGTKTTVVQLKLDDGNVETLNADVSTDSTAIFLNNPLDRIPLLKRAKRLVFGFSPLDRTQVEVAFNLHGLQQAIDSSGASSQFCGW